MNKIIAIDGSAGSGKTSISKLFAKYIGYFYLETGLIYRSLTYYFTKNNLSHREPAKIEESFSRVKIDIDDQGHISVNDEDVTEKLRDGQVNDQVALFAQLSEIRKFARSIQKKLATQRNTVVDGRDIGSVVFPDAFCKFYLEAKTEIRAKRRKDQLAQKGINKTIEEISREMIKRDYYDRTRNQSPLKIAPDAYLIDTSTIGVEEVLNRMVNYYNKQVELSEEKSNLSNGSNEMLKALNNDSKEIRKQYFKAQVMEVGKEIIFDVGEKVDAYIDEKEVVMMKDNLPQVGDVVDVFNMKRTSRGIQVSKLRADQEQSKIRLSKSFENKEIVQGKVKRVIKGGFIIDINELETFCPYSEYDVMNVNTDKQIGVTSDFEVLDLFNRNIIVSRKRPLEKKLNVIHDEFFQKVRIDDILSVEVIKIFDYGLLAKVNLAVNVLIRNRDLAWKFFKHPKILFKIGDQFDIKVTNIVDDPKIQGRKRIEASKRDLEPDPFETFVATHEEGDVIEGKVKRIENFGSFIELTDGVDGLLRISDLTWFYHVDNPEEVVRLGETIKVKILSILKKDRKISVGLKQLQSNPWDTMDHLFPTSSNVSMTVTSTIKNGIYGYVSDHEHKVEAFIHVNDTPYENSKEVDLSNEFKEGDEIVARVYTVNKKKQRLELEIKEQSGNNWEDFCLAYKVGDIVKGKVSEYLENGVQVKINDGISGFAHISQLSEKDDPVIAEEVKIDQSYHFVIQLLSLETKNLRLSIREYLVNQRKKDVQKYINKDANTKIKLSDLLN